METLSGRFRESSCLIGVYLACIFCHLAYTKLQQGLGLRGEKWSTVFYRGDASDCGFGMGGKFSPLSSQGGLLRWRRNLVGNGTYFLALGQATW